MTPTTTDAPLRADAVIAGTLCLMSCYAQHPLPMYAERVAGNLATLAEDVRLTPELRAVCRRLAQRWDAIAGEARGRAAEGAPSDLRELH